MSTALERALSSAGAMETRFGKARRGESDQFYRAATGANYVGVPAQGQQNLDAMAYERNIGWVYAALRPIAQRIASLPWIVGRAIKEPKKDFVPHRHGRLLTAYEIAQLPPHVLQKFGLPRSSHFQTQLRLIKDRLKSWENGSWKKSVHSEAAGVEIIESHPVLELLTDPNQRMIQHSLMAATVASLKLTGKCYWWLAKSTRRKGFDLWPLPSHWVNPKSEDGLIDEGWLVAPPYQVGDPKFVPADRMVFFNYVDPANPFHSIAPARAGYRAIETDEMIQESQKAGYENGISPGLAVITGDIMSPEGKNLGKVQLEDWQLRQIEQRINMLYRGVSKHKRLLVMDRVISDVKEITRANQEMDWMNSSTLTKARIFQIFGVNAIVAGEIEDANRATAVVADESFLSNVVNPDAVLIGEVANDHLMPIYEPNHENVMLWLEQARTHDPEQVRENVKLLSSIRGIVVDEARSAMGMPPLENQMGEVLVSPMTLNIEPADGSLEQVRIDTIQVEAEAAQNSEERAQEQHDVSLQQVQREQNAPKKDRSSKDRFGEQWLKIHGKQENKYASDVEQFFNAQAATAAVNYERLGDKLQKMSIEEVTAKILPNDAKWTKEIKDISEPHLKRSAVIGAQIALKENQHLKPTQKADDIDDILIELPDAVVAHIKDAIRETLRMPYWREITETSRAVLGGAIRKAQTEGDNLRQTVVRIKNALGNEAAKVRAVTVARTETTGALNAGSSAVLDDLIDEGIITGKQWLSTIDQFCRDTHIAANGQKSNADGLFIVGGEYTPYPGWHGLSAKERVHCRCTEIAASD